LSVLNGGREASAGERAAGEVHPADVEEVAHGAEDREARHEECGANAYVEGGARLEGHEVRGVVEGAAEVAHLHEAGEVVDATAERPAHPFEAREGDEA